ncbi:GlxA family transcriptional regulator [Streptomyces sp. NPDC051217]|uniref:GlxA family transcriptional regulator n=1 Tax=Streptomyces sp. NPDC051217 TaxID=3365644 RepID=UPI0037A0C047
MSTHIADPDPAQRSRKRRGPGPDTGAASSPHTVGILLYDEMTLLDVAGPLDVFTTANTRGARYETRLLSLDGGPVTASSGARMLADLTVGEAMEYDTVIVPGACALPPAGADLLAAVRTLHLGATRTAGVCTAAFLLAHEGILTGRAATTHWQYAELLQRSYPGVKVDLDAIYVQDGPVITSAGVTAGIDLALALVREDHSAAMARDVARELVVFLQRPGGQSQFTTLSRVPTATSDAVRRVVNDVLAAPQLAHTTDTMARLAGLSTRHLARTLHAELGVTPAAFVEAARLELAKTLLLSGESITATAHAAGFGSDDTLRRSFTRHLGITPSDYRHRFSAPLQQ